MAENWYYLDQKERRGPVSRDQLQELASSGQLKPTDKVWKKGMANWEPASSVEGMLFSLEENEPPPIPPKDEPPPIPPEDGPPAIPPDTATCATANRMGASLASCVRITGRLLGKRLERAALTKRTIPHAYQALGKHIYAAGSYRSDFPEVYVRLDGLLAEIAVLEKRPTAQAFVAFFHAAKAMLPVAILKSRATLAFRYLGIMAFHKYPELNGAEDALRPLLEARNRLSELEKEIANVSQTQPGQIDTPKNTA